MCDRPAQVALSLRRRSRVELRGGVGGVGFQLREVCVCGGGGYLAADIAVGTSCLCVCVCVTETSTTCVLCVSIAIKVVAVAAALHNPP